MHIKYPRHFTVLTKLNLAGTLWDRYHHHPHFTDKETMPQKKRAPGHPARKWRSFQIHSSNFKCCLYVNITHIMVRNFLKRLLGGPTKWAPHVSVKICTAQNALTLLIQSSRTNMRQWLAPPMSDVETEARWPAISRLFGGRAVTQTQLLIPN